MSIWLSFKRPIEVFWNFSPLKTACWVFLACMLLLQSSYCLSGSLWGLTMCASSMCCPLTRPPSSVLQCITLPHRHCWLTTDAAARGVESSVGDLLLCWLQYFIRPWIVERELLGCVLARTCEQNCVVCTCVSVIAFISQSDLVWGVDNCISVCLDDQKFSGRMSTHTLRVRHTPEKMSWQSVHDEWDVVYMDDTNCRDKTVGWAWGGSIPAAAASAVGSRLHCNLRAWVFVCSCVACCSRLLQSFFI